MKKIVLFDPSYGTSNLGDYIINDAIMSQMNFLFKEAFLYRYSTHTPLIRLHQKFLHTKIGDNCTLSDLKFLGGTNLLKRNLLTLSPDWNISLLTRSLYSNSISLGCGMATNGKKLNQYTRHIYKSTLSHRYIHSTRDERTKLFLEEMGFKAINTGCPTLWKLDRNFCSTITQNKASKVVFTLTDYGKDPQRDQTLIDILNNNYQTVFFWIQGSEDLAYLKFLKGTSRIQLIPPNLTAYDELLSRDDLDYVGTRLHAGIYAIQHKVRSIILAVDNRARDMHADYNLNVIERDDLGQLEKMITSDFATDVRINEQRINLWKQQFE